MTDWCILELKETTGLLVKKAKGKVTS